MQHRTITALPVVGAIAILIATACTTGGQTTASPTAAASEQPQKGGRIIEGTISDIATMQPILVNDTASGRITDLIYENLLIQDPQNGETKPRVATFSQSTDGLTYTYEINAKANWSDGKPIIADDVLTALEGYGKSKKTVRKSNFQDVVGFKDYSDGKATTIPGFKADSSNPKKFSITLTKVSCPAINDLNIKPLPTQIFGKYVQDSSKDEIDSAPENTQPTVFSGQFKFVEWRRGDQEPGAPREGPVGISHQQPEPVHLRQEQGAAAPQGRGLDARGGRHSAERAGEEVQPHDLHELREHRARDPRAGRCRAVQGPRHQRQGGAGSVPRPRHEAHDGRLDARGDHHRLVADRRCGPVQHLALEQHSRPGLRQDGVRLHLLQGPRDGQGDRGGSQPVQQRLLDGRTKEAIRDLQPDPEREPAVQLRLREQHHCGVAEDDAQLRARAVLDHLQRIPVVGEAVATAGS